MFNGKEKIFIIFVEIFSELYYNTEKRIKNGKNNVRSRR